jgi:uncharacterized protein YaaW (UPF0174 family)
MEASLQILEQATREERDSLAAILGCKPTPDGIISALQEQSVDFLSRFMGHRPQYPEILKSVAASHGLKTLGNPEQLEKRILTKLWGDLWNRLSPQQREELNRKLSQELKEKGKGITGPALTGAGLLVANAGGFATYMMASTVVGALTGILGVALPFAFYTGMSSVIAFALGPAGWVGLGLFTLWKLGKPDLSKVTAAICVIGAIRARATVEDPKAFWTKSRLIASLVTILLVLGTVHSFLSDSKPVKPGREDKSASIRGTQSADATLHPLHGHSGGNAASTPVLSTYSNGRFGYSVQYPRDLFIAQGESDRGDGQTFLAADNRATLTAFGGHVGEETIDSLEAEARQASSGEAQKQVTYAVKKTTWFAISGIQGDRVFYQKTFLVNNGFGTILLRYDLAERSKYDPVATAISRSFHCCSPI